jgi:hypothetical protein
MEKEAPHLSGKRLSSSFSPAAQYISAVLCLHSFAETVFLFPLPLLRLIGHFHEIALSFLSLIVSFALSKS